MVGPTPSKYSELGVDVSKAGIESLKSLSDDLFPDAFCSVVRDPDCPGKGLLLHEDGAGSKPIVSYLQYKETGDPGWFEPLASDVVAMNVDDVICAGAKPIVFSDYLAINGFNLRKEDLFSGLTKGFSGVFSLLRSLGSAVLFGGGETADLPDIIKTFDISGAVMARVDLDKVITGGRIAPGDIIVGLRSGGKCSYEKGVNSGIMCNGLTLARHSLLSREYLEKYPEVGSGRGSGYYGRFRLDSEPPELGMTVGEALASPTRIFLPIALELLGKVDVKAMVHNTGGGLTKCLRLGRGIRYVKDNLPEPDPIFGLILQESGESAREMQRDFNMGVGFEVIVRKGDEEEVIRTSERYGVGSQVIGRCERADSGNSLVLDSRLGRFTY